ncbi:hypothetical protein ON010_g7473 [Phytophthora cinnamomi]|nr:hypothetical protein ON010_g7473 [Phytophthora cinnamomi]
MPALGAGGAPATEPPKRTSRRRVATLSGGGNTATIADAPSSCDKESAMEAIEACDIPATELGRSPSLPRRKRRLTTNAAKTIRSDPRKKTCVTSKVSRELMEGDTTDQRGVTLQALLDCLSGDVPVGTGATNQQLLEAISALLSSPDDGSASEEADLVVGEYNEEQREREEEVQAHEENGVRHREADLATHRDVNVSLEDELGDYEELTSDCSSEFDEGSGSEDGDLLHVNYNAEWSDEAVAAYMETLGDDINDDDTLLKLAKNRNEIKAWEEAGWEEVSGSVEPQSEYRGIYTGEWGPTPNVLRHAESPIDIFWFFFPKRLLRQIADESNRYAAQTVVTRARRIRDRQISSQRRGSRTKEVESLAQIRQRLRQMRMFQPHEYAVTFGLLIARMLCPQKRRLSTHWSTSSVGALPIGTFGAWMPRNRFDEVMQHLHFSDNQSEMAKYDRAWKIRPIVDTLQSTFLSGYKPGGFLSFDEGMIPSHSKYNGTRMYMRDKPHKWGTKLFLTCCPKTSYCLRLEVYCGKKAHLGGPQTIDDKSGPAAVLRNLDMVLPKDRQSYHVVVVDRFYTSVALALELLANKIYIVGTIQQRRIGFPSALKEKRKKRPTEISRGSYKVARSKAVPEMSACCWWDSKPVHLLATGASLQELTVGMKNVALVYGGGVLKDCLRDIGRNTWAEGEPSEIPCPKLVKDYHHNMGGVDVHDQLRLQRFSVQNAFRFKKYYKALFLGLLDLALVNAYLVHRTHYSRMGKMGMSHSGFLAMLHAQLLAVKPTDMEEQDDPTPFQQPLARRYINRSDHVPSETQDFHGEVGDPDRKRMHRACKVCSILAAPGKRGKNTKWLCEACSEGRTGDMGVYTSELVLRDRAAETLATVQLVVTCKAVVEAPPKRKVGVICLTQVSPSPTHALALRPPPRMPYKQQARFRPWQQSAPASSAKLPHILETAFSVVDSAGGWTPPIESIGFDARALARWGVHFEVELAALALDTPLGCYQVERRAAVATFVHYHVPTHARRYSNKTWREIYQPNDLSYVENLIQTTLANGGFLSQLWCCREHEQTPSDRSATVPHATLHQAATKPATKAAAKEDYAPITR